MQQAQNIFKIDLELKENRRVDYSDKHFEDEVDFSHTNFSNGVDFIKARFKKNANFSHAYFPKGDVNFIRARFKENANFSYATFLRNVDFTHAHFKENAYFNNTSYSGNVVFTEAKFKKTANFDHTSFTGILLLDEVVIKDDLFAKNMVVNRLDLGKKVSIPKYDEDSVIIVREVYPAYNFWKSNNKNYNLNENLRENLKASIEFFQEWKGNGNKKLPEPKSSNDNAYDRAWNRIHNWCSKDIKLFKILGLGERNKSPEDTFLYLVLKVNPTDGSWMDE